MTEACENVRSLAICNTRNLEESQRGMLINLLKHALKNSMTPLDTLKLHRITSDMTEARDIVEALTLSPVMELGSLGISTNPDWWLNEELFKEIMEFACRQENLTQIDFSMNALAGDRVAQMLSYINDAYHIRGL